MKYSEKLANSIREALVDVPNVEEKPMFGGLCFMVDDKMCICCTRGTEIMCRIGPDEFDKAVEKPGTRPMVHGGRSMKGYIYVDEAALIKKAEFDYWINTSLAYNKIAKSSKKIK
jgi:TfoX/Sxy family transcriptional regulator of competence genes